VPAVTVPIVTIAAQTPRLRLLTVDMRAQPFPFVPGQAVLLGVHGEKDRKPYSIASSPEQVVATGELQLLIATDDGGGGELGWARPGTLVDIEGPIGSFTLPRTVDQHRLLFVAGGTGIAPLRAMIEHAIRALPEHRISVLYSARRSDEFAFVEELREHEQHGRLELHQTVTRDDSSSWHGRRGRIGRAEFEAVVHQPLTTLCFVCGPPSMVDESVATLKALGVPQDAIKTEQWGR
jgi:NAD(P)H-flavin reductase